MNLKREIDKTIGSTKEHEDNVWQKLEQPKRKNRLPLFISLAATAIACLVLAINFWPTNRQEHAITSESPMLETSDGHPFLVRHYQDGSTANIDQAYIVLTAKNQQELDHWLQYFDIEAPGFSFDNYFAIIAQYSSDGCGLVVNKLETANNELILELARPIHLRNKKEIVCTEQLMSNVQILQVKKFTGYDKLTKADFTGADTNTTVNINELNINNQYYNFGLISDYVQVEKVTVNAIQTSKQYILKDEESLQLLSNSIFRSTQMPGEFNVTTSNYQLIVHHKNGKQLMLHIIVDKEKNELIFVSEINKTQAFQLTGEDAANLIKLLKP